MEERGRASLKDRRKNKEMGAGRRNTLTPEQEKAIRLWVWGNPDKKDKEGKKVEGIYYYSTYTELSKDVGVDVSQVSRWFKDFPIFIDEYERQLAERNKEDDRFYIRLRQKAQRTLEKNLNARYARDSTAAALAILGRCGDVDGVRVEVQSLDADKVIRGGYGRPQDDA